MKSIIYILKYDSIKQGSMAIDEKGKETLFSKRPLELLDHWCKQNGSTCIGRMEAFQSLTNSRQKPAILISERTQDIFFPTLSKNHDDCIWLNNKYILKTKAVDLDHTEIQFYNGFRFLLPLNRRIIQNQIARCEKFISVLNHSIGEEHEFKI